MNSCLELAERRRVQVKVCRAVAKSLKREEEVREPGCRAVA